MINIHLGAAAPFLAMALALAGCGPATTESETPPVAAVGDAPWRLASVDGEDVGTVDVVLSIAGGFISGQGPCNTINANYIGVPPEFAIETLITTKVSCPRLGLENRIVSGLVNASSAVVENERLTISGEGSPVLVFRPARS